MLERTHVRERTAGHRRRNVRQTRWVTQPEARPRSRPDGYQCGHHQKDSKQQGKNREAVMITKLHEAYIGWRTWRNKRTMI